MVPVAPQLPLKPLFKIPEVAEATGVPLRSVYAAIENGDIPADQVVRLGGLRVKRAWLRGVLDLDDDPAPRETVA
jgi:predicted DNA-binding transcriptional regulator AlpA